MKTYIITNDSFSNTPDETTFDQLVEMCNECGFSVQLREIGWDGQYESGIIVDENRDVVAVEKGSKYFGE